MRDDITGKYGAAPTQIEVINNPVDFAGVRKKAEEPIAQDEMCDVVSVGRLRPEKAHERLIRAAKHLPALKFGIVGDGEQEPRLRAEIAAAGLEDRVRLLGYRDNPYPFIKNAKVVTLTSLFEGFPNSLLESGALGVPTAVFNTEGGAREIVVEGVTGFYANSNNIEDFVEAIKKALHANLDRDEIARRTRERYQLSTIIPQYEDCIQRRWHQTIS